MSARSKETPEGLAAQLSNSPCAAEDSTQSRGELQPFPGIDEQIENKLAHASRTVTIENSLGLHMRPVMQFVDLANQFDSRILAKKGKRIVDGKNPMELMLLEAVKGTELVIEADGPDAARATEALVDLVKSGFGEE